MRLRWARIADDAPALDARLGRTQADRASALHGSRLAGHLTTRALVSQLLAELAPGSSPELDGTCEACGVQHGPLRALHAPVALSVSTSGEWAMAGAALRSQASAVGVDVEARPERSLAELAPLFAPRPAPTVHDWVRIEAALKADGRGLRVPPGEVRLVGDLAHVPGADPLPSLGVAGPAGTVSAVSFRSA